MKVLDKIGAYILFMGRIFTKPEKKKVYLKELTNELEKLGLNSVMLVMIISFFIGAVLTLQTAYNMSSPLLPRYLIGYLTRETLLPFMSLLPMLGEVMPEEFQNYAGFITDLGPIIQEGKTAELGLVLTQKKTAE